MFCFYFATSIFRLQQVLSNVLSVTTEKESDFIIFIITLYDIIYIYYIYIIIIVLQKYYFYCIIIDRMLTLHAACGDGLLPASWTTFFNNSRNAIAMFMKLCLSEQKF